MSNNWSFAQVWNASLDTDRQRPVEPRDYIWASELGKGLYDRYWKMHGRKPTTPPGLRARRKFEAGNLTEWVMQQVLVRAGILRASQERLEDTTGPIRVSGRCDFIAGGIIQDIDVMELGLPDSFAAIAATAIQALKEKFPNGLSEQGLEIKSCSGTMFDKYKAAVGFHHALQAFFYTKTTNLPYTIVYVSRDDLRVCEWVIRPTSDVWEKHYMQDCEAMSKYYRLPEGETTKESLLLWDGQKFSKNWEVEYSSYLTDYGFERPDEYADKASKAASSLNYIVRRLSDGKELTKKNKEEHLPNGYKFYPGAEEIINGIMENKS